MPLFLLPSDLRPRSSSQGSSARTESSSMLWEEGYMQRKVEVLHDLRHLLSKSEVPLVEAAFKAGAIPVLVQCLSFGSPDEQLLEAAWCLTNIAAGEPEQTKALLPTFL